MRYNLNPVIGSLLRCLQDHRFELVSVDDERKDHKLTGTPRSRRQQAKRVIVENVITNLFLSHPDHEGVPYLVVILCSKIPAMTVMNSSDEIQLNLAIKQFRNKWKNKPCPTK